MYIITEKRWWRWRRKRKKKKGRKKFKQNVEGRSVKSMASVLVTSLSTILRRKIIFFPPLWFRLFSFFSFRFDRVSILERERFHENRAFDKLKILWWFSFLLEFELGRATPLQRMSERIIIIISFFPRAVLWFKYYWILPIIRRVGKSGLSSTWRSYRKRFKIFLFFNSRVYICWYYARDESSVFDRRTLWMVGHVTTYPSISMKC